MPKVVILNCWLIKGDTSALDKNVRHIFDKVIYFVMKIKETDFYFYAN